MVHTLTERSELPFEFFSSIKIKINNASSDLVDISPLEINKNYVLVFYVNNLDLLFHPIRFYRRVYQIGSTDQI